MKKSAIIFALLLVIGLSLFNTSINAEEIISENEEVFITEKVQLQYTYPYNPGIGEECLLIINIDIYSYIDKMTIEWNVFINGYNYYSDYYMSSSNYVLVKFYNFQANVLCVDLIGNTLETKCSNTLDFPLSAFTHLNSDTIKFTNIYQENADLYNMGYEIGITSDFNLKKMIFEILESPFNIVRNVFSFELFGINIASMILFFITIAIVFFVIKGFKR